MPWQLEPIPLTVEIGKVYKLIKKIWRQRRDKRGYLHNAMPYTR